MRSTGASASKGSQAAPVLAMAICPMRRSAPRGIHRPTARFGPTPRLTAWHADPGVSYAYSGIRHAPAPWTPGLLELKEKVEAAAAAAFNSVLLNRYRDGRDSIAPHADAEPELGVNPVIASLSLGDYRRFVLTHPATGARPFGWGSHTSGTSRAAAASARRTSGRSSRPRP